MVIRSMLFMSGALLLAGCADSNTLPGSSKLTTSAVTQTPAVDPACSGLSTQIAQLRQDGVADKIEKASLKKYKMTPADLAKADQLTKANADFQAKCSTLPRSASAAVTPSATAAASASVASSASTAVRSAGTAGALSAGAPSTGAAAVVAKSAVKTVATGDAAAVLAAGAGAVASGPKP